MHFAPAALLLALIASTIGSPVGPASVSAPSEKPLPTSVVIRDGVNKKTARDIKKVRIWQNPKQQPGLMHVAVRFRRTTPSPEYVFTRTWFNTDEDKQPEYLAVATADGEFGVWRGLYAATSWRKVDYETDLLDTGCAAVQIGQQPSVHINFVCLGEEPKSVSVSAVDAYGGDGSTGEEGDHAPGFRKWSPPVRYVSPFTDDVPPSVSMVDAWNDVRHPVDPEQTRKHDLDLRRVHGVLTQLTTADGSTSSALRLTLTHADLKPEHLREVGKASEGPTRVFAALRVIVWLGKESWSVEYGPNGEPYYGWDDGGLTPDCDVPVSNDEDTPSDYDSRITQVADFGKNTVTFTIPTECIPTEQTIARLSGHVTWSIGQSGFWDATTTTRWPFSFTKSAKFRFR